MRILALTFYFQPDLCAGSFRTTPFVSALLERAPPGTHVDVITTMPNRYQTFAHGAEQLEAGPGFEIRRIRLPSHRSDMVGQSRAFAEFAFRVLELVSERQYDLVFATSSRLMTATLGAWIARRKNAKLYLDVRDLFVDTIADVLPAPATWVLGPMFGLIERWTMRRADRINLVSRGFEEYFRRRYSDRSLAWFTNGIDEEFIRTEQPSLRRERYDGRASVLYAGNIGDGQALHQIVPALARELHGHASFVIIGDGGRRRQLEEAIRDAELDNVVIRGPMPRAELLKAYREADVLFLHLGAFPALEKVLPSKVFEYAALGKPVLAGVGGYAARFVLEEIRNAAVFPPCDVQAAVRAFMSLQMGECPRPEFVARYSRLNISKAMADDVLGLLGVSRAET